MLCVVYIQRERLKALSECRSLWPLEAHRIFGFQWMTTTTPPFNSKPLFLLLLLRFIICFFEFTLWSSLYNWSELNWTEFQFSDFRSWKVNLLVARQFLPPPLHFSSCTPQFCKFWNWPPQFRDLRVCYGFINPKVNHVAFWMRECFGSKICINYWFPDC